MNETMYPGAQGISPTNPWMVQQSTTVPHWQKPQNNTNSSGGFMTIFVSSEDEVNRYPVAAGLTVLLISFNLGKFWLKGTDTSGIPSQLRSFSFEEKTPQIQNGSEFVSRTEFESLSGKLDKLLAELGGDK